jgi:phage antirepressor YoqD-like protein
MWMVNRPYIKCGDFNLPDIEWKDLSKVQVKENSKNTEIHQDFIDHITDRGLVQLVNQSTRDSMFVVCGW